eukprot:GABW01001693.1.p1 GENE.GABW01001693.1~~GABW01001693.1.p1  ORF type:complete len:71 (-),score=31.40 GABW01001693.1:119-331(-)
MGTKNVEIATEVNKYVWMKGIRNVPKRIRVRMERRRSEDEDDESLYTVVTLVETKNFKNMQTIVVTESEE